MISTSGLDETARRPRCTKRDSGRLVYQLSSYLITVHSGWLTLTVRRKSHTWPAMTDTARICCHPSAPLSNFISPTVSQRGNAYRQNHQIAVSKNTNPTGNRLCRHVRSIIYDFCRFTSFSPLLTITAVVYASEPALHVDDCFDLCTYNTNLGTSLCSGKVEIGFW